MFHGRGENVLLRTEAMAAERTRYVYPNLAAVLEMVMPMLLSVRQINAAMQRYPSSVFRSASFAVRGGCVTRLSSTRAVAVFLAPDKCIGDLLNVEYRCK